MYQVEVASALEWAKYSKQSHEVVFGEERSPNFDRIDYALLATYKGEVGGFITIKEMDAKTCYIQYGGVFPNFEKSLHVIKGYKAFLDELKKHYDLIWTRVENTNLPMLKMALSQGFLINGCSVVRNKIYLELLMEV